MASCNSCQQNVVPNESVEDTLVDTTLTLSMVKNYVSTDRQQMFVKVGGDYRWYETLVEFDNYYDEDSTQNIHTVINIFQVCTEVGESTDVVVYACTHTLDSSAVFPKSGFWIEDWPLNEEQIKLTFDEAFERMMATNMPKPHSRQACLRKPVGPLVCNPQYVFGNLRSQIWVDAVTGEVKNSNPAFPEGFTMPLDEWP